MDCLFCSIVAGEVPSKKVYEDDQILAFYDIDPQAPVHFLVIPKEHIVSPDAIDESNSAIVGHIYAVIAKLSKELGLSLIHIRCVYETGASLWATSSSPVPRLAV